MSCPDCGARVATLFNGLENRRCLNCLEKARLKFVAEQKRKRGEK